MTLTRIVFILLQGVGALVVLLYFACFGDHPSFVAAFQNMARLVNDTLHGRDMMDNYEGLTWGQVGVTVRLILAAVVIAVILGILSTAVRFQLRMIRIGWLYEALSIVAESIPEPLYVVLAVVVFLYAMTHFGIRDLPLFPEGLPRWNDTWIPAIAIALPGAFYTERMLYLKTRDEGARPYVDTARAKGFTRRRVWYTHVLPNAFPILLKLLPGVVSLIVSSAVFAEFFMDYQGALFQLTQAIGWNMVTGEFSSFEKPFHLPLYQPGLVFLIGALVVGIWVLLRIVFEWLYAALYGGSQ